MTGALPDLVAAADRLVLWLQRQALPHWAERGRDGAGGFYEDLTPDGDPRTNRERRVRVQPRQAYVFAHAAMLGWHPDARAVSDGCFDYLLRHAAIGDPVTGTGFDGFVHRLRADGSVADPRRDTYDHAFVLLACAWRIGAFGDDKSHAVLENTLAYLDRTVRDGTDGSYREGVPAVLPRRQNPHMHLFEAFLALHRHTGEARFAERARGIFTLFERHFYDDGEGVIREFFDDDWHLDPDRGHLVEPGHMVEWVWLLDQAEAQLGIDAARPMARLYDMAERLGQEPSGDFLLDAVALKGPHPAPARRTWVQTEYVKSTLVRARRGVAGAEEKAARLIGALLDGYTTADPAGGYIDRFDADGAVLSDAMPASTLYHLLSAGAEAKRTADALHTS